MSSKFTLDVFTRALIPSGLLVMFLALTLSHHQLLGRLFSWNLDKLILNRFESYLVATNLVDNEYFYQQAHTYILHRL